MVRVLLIAFAGACTSGSRPATTVPGAPLDRPAPAIADTLWDRGTFVVVDKEKVEPAEEAFEIYRTASGYRFQLTWKRVAPTGEPADGTVTLETDARFSPVTGTDTMNLHASTGVEVTHSALRRDPDGRLTTIVTAASGAKDTATSKGPSDWFIGGQFTTFLTVICQASPDLTSPVVYPDKATTLDPAKPLPIEGTSRNVTYRVLTYAGTKNRFVAACEDGKLAGEVTRGVTIVRKDDLALARTLEKWFR